MTDEGATAAAAGYELAFNEGKAAVQEQSTTLKEMRDRVGTIVSSAAVVAGLGVTLGLSGNRGQRLTTWGAAGGVLATAAFVGLVIATVQIWRPFTGVFILDPGVIVGSYVDPPDGATLAETHRELALHLGNHVAFNRESLSDRLVWFTAALYLFLLEVAGLVVMLMDVAQ